MDTNIRRSKPQTVMVLLNNTWDLGIETVCNSSLFLIIFQGKYSLLIITSTNVSVGMSVGITAIHLIKHNTDHHNHHLPHICEGMMVYIW